MSELRRGGKGFGPACMPMTAQEHADHLPGAIRAVQFDCPLSGVKEGYNQARIEQNPNQSEQQIVWAELRIEPLSPSS